ncbi:MAG TPA: hypothetical protein PKC18_10930, partial [Lacipirellulaceae bacterium]|nr:hypothetical protein [Lacipirellulaceae bacterium]
EQDAVVLASAPSDPAARQLAAAGVYVVDVARLPSSRETLSEALPDHGGPRPIRAVFTGVTPVMHRAQSELLSTLAGSWWQVAGAVAIVVTVGLMSIPAGLLALVPSLAPLAAAYGALGWLGVKIDLGIMMTGIIALGLAVQGTVHFAGWFRRALDEGRPRRDAVLHAYQRSAPAMLETLIIGGGSLVTLGFSVFTPIREFGLLMPVMLAAALAGNLLLFPAMLASPLGWFFASADQRRRQPLLAKVQARLRARGWLPQNAEQGGAHRASAPHFDSAPTPGRRVLPASAGDDRHELVDGPHAALHAKLQQLRRSRTGDSAAS